MNYVAGFLIDPDTMQVVLVRKTRPAWQSGALNGVGGKIEEGESAIVAMRREFFEETGHMRQDWTEFCVLRGQGFTVTFFSAFDVNLSEKVRTTTDEEIVVKSISGVHPYNAVPNLMWLLPMALSLTWDAASAFDITERKAV